MKSIDNSTYEIYINFSGKKEDVQKFKDDIFGSRERKYFDFSKILPVPKEIDEEPMIDGECYCALILAALLRDPDVHYYGNIRDKYSRDKFYEYFLRPFKDCGIQYKSYTEKELIEKVRDKEEFGHDKSEDKTIDKALAFLIKKSEGAQERAFKILQNMYRYGCATRYAWRMKYWGTPLNSTGCSTPKTEDESPEPVLLKFEDSLLVYTSGGNAMDIFKFLAQKYYKLYFIIVWRRVDEHPIDEKIYGEDIVWSNGKLVDCIPFFYEGMRAGHTREDLDQLFDEMKKKF